MSITAKIELVKPVSAALYKEPAQHPAVSTAQLTPQDYGCCTGVQFVIPRGTPYTLKFNIKDFKIWQNATSGHWWYNKLKNGDKAFFGIKKHPDDSEYIYTRIVKVNWSYQHNDNDVLVEKELGDMTSHGSFTITLSEIDTDIEPGVYYYSIAALVSDKKNENLRNYEYKEPCFVEISPPVPFRIRPMMAKLADMYDYYVRLIADTDEKIALLTAKAQNARTEEERQTIEDDISSLKKIKLNHQTEMRKIQKRLTS